MQVHALGFAIVLTVAASALRENTMSRPAVTTHTTGLPPPCCGRSPRRLGAPSPAT